MKIIYGTKEELSKQVSDIYVEQLTNKPNSKLILATGSSPILVYDNLIEESNKNKSLFEKVETYNLDEYVGSEEFPELSFKNFMDNHLFSKVNIDSNNINFPSIDVDLYNSKLDKIDFIDLTILGTGSNGHIAFNEPGTKYENRTHIVTLTQSTMDDNFKGIDDHPTQAITMGIIDIFTKSKKIVLLAWGEHKRASLEKLLEGKITSEWPITYLLKHDNFIIFTDIKL